MTTDYRLNAAIDTVEAYHLGAISEPGCMDELLSLGYLLDFAESNPPDYVLYDSEQNRSIVVAV